MQLQFALSLNGASQERENRAYERSRRLCFSSNWIRVRRAKYANINCAGLIYERKILSQSKQLSVSVATHVGAKSDDRRHYSCRDHDTAVHGASISNCIQFLWNSLLGRVLRRRRRRLLLRRRQRWQYRSCSLFLTPPRLFPLSLAQNLLSVVIHSPLCKSFRAFARPQWFTNDPVPLQTLALFLIFKFIPTDRAVLMSSAKRSKSHYLAKHFFFIF